MPTGSCAATRGRGFDVDAMSATVLELQPAGQELGLLELFGLEPGLDDLRVFVGSRSCGRLPRVGALSSSFGGSSPPSLVFRPFKPNRSATESRSRS